jgi:hypothetical protein
MVLGVGLLLQHLAGVGGRPAPLLRRYNHPISHSVLLDVIVHSGYNSLRQSRSTNVRPPAHTNRRTEDHVWFEDRWMVTSLCDE